MNRHTRICFDLYLIRSGIRSKDIRLFLKFLLREEVYHIYFQELILYWMGSPYKISRTYPESLIDDTLYWVGTTQGQNFWKKIDEKLRIYFSKIKEKEWEEV